MADVLFSFLLFLASSALLLGYVLVMYLVVCAAFYAWERHTDEYILRHGKLYDGGRDPRAFIVFAVNRFVILPGIIVLFLGYHIRKTLDMGSPDINSSRFSIILWSSFVLLLCLCLTDHMYRAWKLGSYPGLSRFFRNKKSGFALVVLFAALCFLPGTGVLFLLHHVRKNRDMEMTDIISVRFSNITWSSIFLLSCLFLAVYVYRAWNTGRYPGFFSYCMNKKAGLAFLFLFAVLCNYYIGGLAHWLGPGSLHRKAKCYLVAGENLHAVKWLLTSRLPLFPIHPNNWKIQPITALQRVIFNRAARLLPDDDAEAAAWKTRWFHRPYTVGLRGYRPGERAFSGPGGKRPGTRALMADWRRCLEVLNAQPIRDARVRRELYMLDAPLLAWLVYNSLPVTREPGGGNDDEDERRRKLNLFLERTRSEMAPWLLKLTEDWKNEPDFRKILERHPESEAKGQLVLMAALDAVIRAEVRQGAFRCDNDSARQYLATRQAFFEPDTGEPAYRRVPPPLKTGPLTSHYADAEGLYSYATTWTSFGQYVLEQRCGLPVPGRSDPREDCWPVRRPGEELTPDQCLEKLARDHLDEELQLMLDKLPRRAPEPPPAPSNPNETASP